MGADASLQCRDSNPEPPSPEEKVKGRHTLIKSLLPWLTPEPLDPFCLDSGDGASIRRAGESMCTRGKKGNTRLRGVEWGFGLGSCVHID